MRAALSLLVIDDDDVDRERVLRMLARSQLDVEAMEAACGAEALRLVRMHSFDCIMLDNQLGDTCGLDLLPALHRQALNDCPVIMITGAGDESVAVRLLREGATDYLSKKTLSVDTLVQSIRDSVERHQRVQQRDHRRHLLERDLKALLDHMPAMIGYWDAAFSNRFANRAYCQACGLAAGAMAGLTMHQALGEAKYRAIKDHAVAALSGQEQSFESVWPSSDKHPPLHLHTHLVPDQAADGSISGFYLLQTDITAMKATQEELAAARDAANAAAHTKSEFLANMSHEIRTPMNAIVGLSRLALEDELGMRSRQCVEKVHTAALALTGLLDDVLDYSRVESGRLRFETINFDLMDLLQRAVDLFALKIAQKGLDFSVLVAPDVPWQIVGDQLRLSQVLHNLIGNAVKFTDRGEIEVRVTRRVDPEPGRCRLSFCIRDTGVGVSPAQHAGLFQAFTQVDSSVTRRFGGSGLGLAICKRLVEQMGGTIGIDSELGRGSELSFDVCLALQPGALEVRALPVRRALLLEADVQRAMALKSQLDLLGVQVATAADSRVALERLSRSRADEGPDFDLVLLDWDAVDENPLKLMAALRETRNGRSIVAHISPLGCELLPAPGQALRPDLVLSRPVLTKTLRDGLLNLIDGVAAIPTQNAGGLVALRRRAGPIHGARVLVVEDNEVNRLVATQFLERIGLRFAIACDGIEAEAAVRDAGACGFDAVLMDLHMPRLDGLEATRRIHAVPNAGHLPVIAMSAAVLERERADALAAGMVDHLAKPLIVERLVEVLLEWIPHQSN